MEAWMDGWGKFKHSCPFPPPCELNPVSHLPAFLVSLPSNQLWSWYETVLCASWMVCFPWGIDRAKDGEKDHEVIIRAILTGKSHKETTVHWPQSGSNLGWNVWVPAQFSSLQIALQLQMKQLSAADLRVCHTDGEWVWSSHQDV